MRSYSIRSNRLKDLFLKYNAAIPSSAAIERFFSIGKNILKPKSGLSELDDLSQMVLFLKDNSESKYFNSFVSSVHFASPSVDKVVTIRESLKTWVDFLTACIQRGLINVKQSCAMGSPSEIGYMSPLKYFSSCSIRFCRMFKLCITSYYFISAGLGLDWLSFAYLNAS